jgi:hypothetical protein
MSLPLGVAMSSSPHSVDETGTTNHGTPSTNLTAPTPEPASGAKASAGDSVAGPSVAVGALEPYHA